jgi:hypothetical protein
VADAVIKAERSMASSASLIWGVSFHPNAAEATTNGEQNGDSRASTTHPNPYTSAAC